MKTLILLALIAVPNGGPGNSNGETIFGDHHFYGNAWVHENTDAFVIDVADEWHLIYDDAWITGTSLNGVTIHGSYTLVSKTSVMMLTQLFATFTFTFNNCKNKII